MRWDGGGSARYIIALINTITVPVLCYSLLLLTYICVYVQYIACVSSIEIMHGQCRADRSSEEHDGRGFCGPKT